MRIVRILFLLACLFTPLLVHGQERPVVEWSDWSSYGTAIGNPLSAGIAGWRSGNTGCALERLAISEGVGNLATLGIKHFVTSPRPCLGCAADGLPSGHTMNSVIGATGAQWGGLRSWQRWAVSSGLVVLTGFLRHDANRHTWTQVASGAAIGAGAEAFGQLLRCGP